MKAWSEARGDAAQQEENDETQMSHGVLHIVAEHPEKQHVADEVKQGAVQEDVGDERQLHRHEGITVRQHLGAEQDRRDEGRDPPTISSAPMGSVEGQNVDDDAQARSDSRVASGVFMFLRGTPS